MSFAKRLERYLLRHCHPGRRAGFVRKILVRRDRASPAGPWRALLALAVLAFAASLAAPASARDCETWSFDTKVRCLSQGDAARQGETVRIENAGDKIQTFSHQEWYSVCGQASGRPPSPPILVVLQPKEVASIQLPPHPDAKPGDGKAYCTEFFIFDCNNGQQVCGVDLIAEITPPATLAARSCEGWSDALYSGSYDTVTNIRCVAERAAARRGATVTITNISTEQVSFRIDEWHSACGFSGRDLSDYDRYHSLNPGQSLTYATKQNTEMHTLSQDILDRCTEVLVRECVFGDVHRACAIVLSAEIVP